MTDPTISQDARVDLIDAIIADYHTTRAHETPAAAHILTKHRSCQAFARFEAHLRTPATDTEAMRLLLADLHSFMDVAGGEGFVCAGFDAADLFTRIDALAKGGA